MASFDIKWAHAKINLGYRLVRHLLLKLWPWRQRYGLQRFVDNYVHEGLPAANARYRLYAHESGRCTSCGDCDQICPLLLKTSTKHFSGPMEFILCGTRAAPHLRDIRSTLELLVGPECAECGQCVAHCPEEIPILKLAQLHHDQLLLLDQADEAHRLHRALPPPQPPEQST